MLTATITGTLRELQQMWPWETLCNLVHIDPHRLGSVPDDEQFTITQDDLLLAKMITPDDND
jgi:hypothetical protein